MPTFITIGYGDQNGYDNTDKAVRDAAHAHDAQMIHSGALVGVALNPVQVRNHDDAGVETRNGPYLRADLPLAGFAVIEAATLDEAVRLSAQAPCAVAHGVVEVWQLDTPA